MLFRDIPICMRQRDRRQQSNGPLPCVFGLLIIVEPAPAFSSLQTSKARIVQYRVNALLWETSRMDPSFLHKRPREIDTFELDLTQHRTKKVPTLVVVKGKRAMMQLHVWAGEAGVQNCCVLRQGCVPLPGSSFHAAN